MHLVTKAFAILCNDHCQVWRQKKLIYYSGLLEHVTRIMALGKMAPTREGARLCQTILRNPEDMILWLKFQNSRLVSNSACTEDILIQHGEPHQLPKNKGLYRDWGAFFDFGDVIEISNGIKLNPRLLEQWSISFWMILPLTIYETNKRHILVQSVAGSGAYIQIDETGQDLQTVCELSGRTLSAGFNLNLVKVKGWHHITVTCNNLHVSGKGAIKFYIDGVVTHPKPQNCFC